MPKIKGPKKSASKHLLKVHTSSNQEPSEKKKPIFSFQHLDPKYCISCCTLEDKAALADQLRVLSTLSWVEIRQAGRHGIGSEKIARNAIRRPIPPHIHEDTTFLALRFSGKKPMVGYRDGDIFHILWLDRDFTLYDHGS